MMRSIASVLVDFRAEQVSAHSAIMDAEIRSEPIPVDVEAIAQEAEERGYERGREEARREHEAILMQMQGESSQQIEDAVTAARQRWVEEEAEQIQRRIEDAFAQMRDLISDQVASVLQAAMKRSLRDKMIEDLKSTLDMLTLNDSTLLLRVEGPADLMEPIRRGLSNRVRSVDLFASDIPDVRVTAQDCVVESHLQTWHDILAGDEP